MALLARQVGYQNRLFRRTAISAFFTLAFPLIFLLLFGAIFDDIQVAPGQAVAAAQFYAPGLAVFTAVSATYTNIGITTAIYRDEGILMRIRSTPLPRWVYMGGIVGSAVAIAVVGSLVMLAV
ncbi:MAG: ABC-2 type transport system permease protein, partial [Acidimicrobiales bacterium]